MFVFYILLAEIENIRALIPVLKAITIKKTAVMGITNRGLKITCEEESRVVQGALFVDKNMFQKYEMREENMALTIQFKMADLLTAISILFPNRPPSAVADLDFLDNSSNVLQIKYEREDRLKLQVVSGNHSAMAYIQTFLPDNLVIYSMAFVNKIILDASVLIDFWRCYDSQSTHVEIGISNEDQMFTMATESELGRFVYKVHSQSMHVEHYECTVPMKHRYEMHATRSTVRPLVLASKVSVRMDSSGLLNMQFLIRLEPDPTGADYSTASNTSNRNANPVPAGMPNIATPPQARPQLSLSQEIQKCFIEFYLVPSVDLDEEQE